MLGPPTLNSGEARASWAFRERGLWFQNKQYYGNIWQY